MAKKELTIAEKFIKAFCTNHGGKMAGVPSLSTSCLANPICQERAKDPKSICAHCFAAGLMKCRPSIHDKGVRNYEFLSAAIYPVEEMPILNYLVFRLESFGDLGNVNQAGNYFNLAAANPRTMFALWTKNPHIIAEMMETTGIEKPRNLVIVYSSPKVNEEHDPGERYPFIDKVFTVYDKEHAETVEINCGARNCLKCGRCYSKRTGRHVREILK